MAPVDFKNNKAPVDPNWVAQSEERGPIPFPKDNCVDTAKQISSLPRAAGAELVSGGPFSGVPLPALIQPTEAIGTTGVVQNSINGIGGSFGAGFGGAFGGGPNGRGSGVYAVSNLNPISQAALREAGNILNDSPFLREDLAALSHLAFALQSRAIGKVHELVTAAAETIAQIRVGKFPGEYPDGSPVGTDCVVLSFSVWNLSEVGVHVVDRSSAPNVPVRVEFAP
jgi:hypothetical protein